MKKYALFLILILMNINVAIADQPETLDRGKYSAQQMEAIRELERNENYYLKVVKTSKDPLEKDRALTALGGLYSIKNKFKKAEYYLKQVGASAKHNTDNLQISAAWYTLAMLYLHGKGDIKKDYIKAYKYFTRAAEAGNIDSMTEAYVMCKNKEVPADMIRRFTKKTYKTYKNHPTLIEYSIALKNLRIQAQCGTERKYLKERMKKDGL